MKGYKVEKLYDTYWISEKADYHKVDIKRIKIHAENNLRWIKRSEIKDFKNWVIKNGHKYKLEGLK